MDGPNMIGLSGALIAGYAYIPQITHLIKERCSAGISSGAFALWLLSSVLVTINAIYIHSIVFIVLGAIQIGATGTIYIFSVKYRGQVCPFHETHVPQTDLKH
jgi:uncharacterized protein with PQ loop repeat